MGGGGGFYRGKGVKWGKWPVGMWTCCYQVCGDDAAVLSNTPY